MESACSSVSCREDLYKQLTEVIGSNIKKISLSESLMSTALTKIQNGHDSESIKNELHCINKSTEMLVNDTHDKVFNLMNLKQVNFAQEQYRIGLKSDYLQALDNLEATRIAAAATMVEGNTLDLVNGGPSSCFSNSYLAYLERKEIERQKRLLLKICAADDFEKIKQVIKECQMEPAAPANVTSNDQYGDYVLQYEDCDLDKLVHGVSNKNVLRAKMMKTGYVFLTVIYPILPLFCIMLVLYMFGFFT